MIPTDTVSGFFNSSVAIIDAGGWGNEAVPLLAIFILGANIALDGPPAP